MAITNASFAQPAPDELIRIAQAGIVVTGLINIVGLIIRFAGGKETIDKILPPIVTSSVAAVIGIGLGKAALDMTSGVAGGVEGGDLGWWADFFELPARTGRPLGGWGQNLGFTYSASFKRWMAQFIFMTIVPCFTILYVRPPSLIVSNKM